jgi:hypothetical protein
MQNEEVLISSAVHASQVFRLTMGAGIHFIVMLVAGLNMRL